MSNAWTGFDGKAKSIKDIYIGINNKARKCLCAYIGVNGKAHYTFPPLVSIPTVTGGYEYNGNDQSAIINYDDSNVILSGEITAKNAGVHTIVASLKYDYLRWSDGTRESKNITWTIEPMGLPNPEPTSYNTPTTIYTGRFVASEYFYPKLWTVYKDYPDIMGVSNYSNSVNVGAHTVTFVIYDSNYKFSSTNSNSVTVTYDLIKAYVVFEGKENYVEYDSFHLPNIMRYGELEFNFSYRTKTGKWGIETKASPSSSYVYVDSTKGTWNAFANNYYGTLIVSGEQAYSPASDIRNYPHHIISVLNNNVQITENSEHYFTQKGMSFSVIPPNISKGIYYYQFVLDVGSYLNTTYPSGAPSGTVLTLGTFTIPRNDNYQGTSSHPDLSYPIILSLHKTND